ncbi:MAG: hypothetical protein LBC84_04345 [Prevotellaceae bacterium]|jgi:hypothetical protein|nr:hypothetical protein [Prevotellaceae bacterium]
MFHFYNNFIKALEERHPRKSDLTNALLEILPLEKESIYRRLRKDIYFTIEEAMQIAEAWNISLDNILRIDPNKTRPFHFNMIEYVHPKEADYKILEGYNRDLALFIKDPQAKRIEVINALPRSLYCRSEPLTRFFSMKWLFQYGNTHDVMTFGNIQIPERMRKIDLEYVQLMHEIPEIQSIHDQNVIKRLIDEIRYYRSIGMVKEDEAALLKEELLKLIDYMEGITGIGSFPDSGSKFFFYLSHTWLDTEYLIFDSKLLKWSFIRILERNSIASSDKTVFDKFMNVVNSIKRSSVLMSGSNTLQQVEFFNYQRDLVSSI